MITVYHNKKFTDMLYMMGDVVAIRDAVIKLTSSELVKVADVATDDLDVAYRQTNNIDTPWYQNADVVAYDRDSRSTSVGDVMVRGEDLYVVASSGFLKI